MPQQLPMPQLILAAASNSSCHSRCSSEIGASGFDTRYVCFKSTLSSSYSHKKKQRSSHTTDLSWVLACVLSVHRYSSYVILLELSPITMPTLSFVMSGTSYALASLVLQELLVKIFIQTSSCSVKGKVFGCALMVEEDSKTIVSALHWREPGLKKWL